MTESPNDPAIAPIYVVDTNALIWYLTGHPKLSKRVGAIFGTAERGETLLVFSAISLAEMYYSNKKFRHFVDFKAVYRTLVSNPAFLFLPFHPEDVLDFEEDSLVPGMHDRIVTGLARRLGVPLVASDPEILNAGLVETIW